MTIDEYDFDATASVVYQLNPSVRSHFASVEAFKTYMIDMAHTYMGNAMSLSTYGFCLHAFVSEDKLTRHVSAKVTPSLVLKYLRKEETVHA